MSMRILALFSCFSLVGWSQKPVIFPGGAVNSASYTTEANTYESVGQGLAGGSIVSIFGTNLAASTETASIIPLPAELGGATVIVNGRPAPLFYVSPGQINFQMPSPWLYSNIGRPASIVVSTAAGMSEPHLLDWVVAPGIFAGDASGCGQGAVVNVKGDGTVSVNSPHNSVSPGEYISVYGTGLDAVYDSPPDGVPAPTSPPASIAGSWGSYFDFAANTAAYGSSWAGRAPGLIGVDQFNVHVPDTVREGCAVPLQVVSSYAISQPVTISIRKGGGTCADPPSAGYGQITWEKTVTTPSSGPSAETDTLTVSLQTSPGKQVPPPPPSNQRGWDLFGPSCRLPGYRSLDAGAIVIQGPGFSSIRAPLVPLQDGQVSGLKVYRAALPAGSIRPGSFGAGASGGADVGAFQSTVRVGSDIHVTTALAGGGFSQHQPIVVNWTGGDPDAWVTFKLVSHIGYVDESNSVQARASAGTITLAPFTIGGASGFAIEGPDIEITLEVTPDPSQIPTFAAPGLALGGQHLWKYTYRFQGILLQ